MKTLELDSPWKGRILREGVGSVIKHACVKKSAGISWGFHISHRDLTAASDIANTLPGLQENETV